MIVRSSLIEFTFVNSDTLIDKYRHFFEKIRKNRKYFLSSPREYLKRLLF